MLRFREGAWEPLSVPWTAGPSLWGGPESALGEMGEWSGLASHFGLQEPLLLGVTGYCYSQVIKSIN